MKPILDDSQAEGKYIVGALPEPEDNIGVERHLGPGNHPSGSPQEVHAGDEIPDETMKLTKTNLNKLIRWTTSIYNEFRKKEVVDWSFQILKGDLWRLMWKPDNFEGSGIRAISGSDDIEWREVEPLGGRSRIEVKVKRAVFRSGVFAPESGGTGGDYLINGEEGYIAIGVGNNPWEFTEQERIYFDGEAVRRHLGPGDHPSGSPQSVHAGKGKDRRTEDATNVHKPAHRRAGNEGNVGSAYIMAQEGEEDARLLGWHPESQQLLWIDPEHYLSQLAHHMERGYGERDLLVSETGVDELKKKMMDRHPLDSLWVDVYVDADRTRGIIQSQEGRHRAWAAIDLAIGRVPVITYFRDEATGIYINLADENLDLQELNPWGFYMKRPDRRPITQRHGVHIGQEGVKEQVGGSKPEKEIKDDSRVQSAVNGFMNALERLFD